MVPELSMRQVSFGTLTIFNEKLHTRHTNKPQASTVTDSVLGNLSCVSGDNLFLKTMTAPSLMVQLIILGIVRDIGGTKF